MHIVFVTANYPYKSRPFHGTFVKEFVEAISRTGAKCSIIRPVSVFERSFWKSYSENCQSADDHMQIQVFNPRYFSASAKKIGFFNSYWITHMNYARAVRKSLSKINKPDLLYGHFLYPSGAVVTRLATKIKMPSFVAVGDSVIRKSAMSARSPVFADATGIIAVSSKTYLECKREFNICERRIGIFPNGVNLATFYPRNRIQMRMKYELDPRKIIVAFTGHFNERKGPHRLLEAISKLENVGVIFIGEGKVKLESDQILFKGVLEHEKIPEMLSAADIFVLPTLAEGSCNAIIEAMACGLPIITSKGGHNDDIIDDSVGIRINPMNIGEIRNAVLELYEDKQLREEMGSNALKKAKQFDIDNRAKKVLQWIREICFEVS